jgi:acyl carrier protein
MSREEMLLLMDEVVEAEPGTVSFTDMLKDIPGWDSMAVIMFQAEIDNRLGIQVEPIALARCQTVEDLLELLDDQVAAV